MKILVKLEANEAIGHVIADNSMAALLSRDLNFVFSLCRTTESNSFLLLSQIYCPFQMIGREDGAGGDTREV